MARVKLPPAGSQLILGLIPVALGICSTLVSEERQIYSARQEPNRAEQTKWQSTVSSCSSYLLRAAVRYEQSERKGVVVILCH